MSSVTTRALIVLAFVARAAAAHDARDAAGQPVNRTGHDGAADETACSPMDLAVSARIAETFSMAAWKLEGNACW
jgi:hypothetical protein